MENLNNNSFEKIESMVNSGLNYDEIEHEILFGWSKIYHKEGLKILLHVFCEDCDKCKGEKESVCPDCGGDGLEICCECGSEVNCKKCKGTGVVKCKNCDSTGKQNKVKMQFILK